MGKNKPGRSVGGGSATGGGSGGLLAGDGPLTESGGKVGGVPGGGGVVCCFWVALGRFGGGVEALLAFGFWLYLYTSSIPASSFNNQSNRHRPEVREERWEERGGADGVCGPRSAAAASSACLLRPGTSYGVACCF